MNTILEGRLPNWYLAFAEWRLERPRHTKTSIKFFRQSRHHMVIWTFVMRGYYRRAPPSCNDCVREVDCAKETARKIILAAQSKGYFEMRPSADGRKKLLWPSLECVADYESMVDTLLSLAEVINPG